MLLTLSRLREILKSFPKLSIALIGDLFLDQYLEVDKSLEEISIETGKPAWQVTGVRNQPGALGTVMSNLAALGVGKMYPVTVIGDDGRGHELMECLGHLPVDLEGVLRASDRLTPTYTKPMEFLDARDSAIELNRLDLRSRSPLSSPMLSQLGACCEHAFRRADAVIVLDQIADVNQGVVHDVVRQKLRSLARRSPEKPVIVDSRDGLSQFDFGILKGNATEFARAFGVEHIDEILRAIVKKTGNAVYCTRGSDGIAFASPANDVQAIPGVKVTGSIDIVGAGDSVSSALAAALPCGATFSEAGQIANLVASITIQQLGTTGTAEPAQLIQRYKDVFGD